MYQEKLLIISIKRLKDFGEEEGRDRYRTRRADITGTFLIKDLLDDAKEKFQNPNIDERERKMSKIRVRLLLHIFADTYAHENFSGFHGWENFSYLSGVTDNYDDDKDITNDYNRDFYYGIYSIGHANVGNATDDTFISLDIKMSENSTQREKENYTLTFSRSNTQVFCDVAKQIFRYICSLNGKEENEVEAIWRDVHEHIKRGFKCHSTEVNELAAQWREICPNINYRYDKKDYCDNQLIPLLFDENVTLEEKLEENNIAGIYKTAQDDFFYYNLVAKEIRDKIIE